MYVRGGCVNKTVPSIMPSVLQLAKVDDGVAENVKASMIDHPLVSRRTVRPTTRRMPGKVAAMAFWLGVYVTMMYQCGYDEKWRLTRKLSFFLWSDS